MSKPKPGARPSHAKELALRHLYDRGGAGVVVESGGMLRMPRTDGHGCPSCGACGLGGHGGNCPKAHLTFSYAGNLVEDL